VRALVLTLQERFPGSELVFDGTTPFIVWLHNLELRSSRVGARLHWSLRYGRELESWSPGLHLIEEWFYFDRPEPRLGVSQMMRYVPALAEGVGASTIAWAPSTLPAKRLSCRRPALAAVRLPSVRATGEGSSRSPTGSAESRIEASPAASGTRRIAAWI